MNISPMHSRTFSTFVQGVLWFLLASIVVALDQYSKIWIMQRFTFGETQILTNYFNLVLVGNPGAAFSFLADASGWQRWFFTGLSMIISIVVSIMLIRYLRNKLMCCALALLLGGAIGNVLDRLQFGYVIDFIDLHIQHWHWPAFNLADSAITLAIILIIIDEIRRIRQKDLP